MEVLEPGRPREDATRGFHDDKKLALKRMQNRQHWEREIQAREDLKKFPKQMRTNVIEIVAWHGPENEEPFTPELRETDTGTHGDEETRTQEVERTNPDLQKKYWILMDLAYRDLACVPYSPHLWLLASGRSSNVDRQSAEPNARMCG